MARPFFRRFFHGEDVLLLPYSKGLQTSWQTIVAFGAAMFDSSAESTLEFLRTTNQGWLPGVTV
jgi:hypothetical protein